MFPLGNFDLLVHYRLRVSVTRHVGRVTGGSRCSIEVLSTYVQFY